MADLALRRFLNSIRMPRLLDFDLDQDELSDYEAITSGLSVSEDDKHIYVEAAVPGVDPSKIEVTTDNGILWIRGEQEQEQNERRYYRRAATSFSYRFALPENADTSKEPKATYKNGIMRITFDKLPESQPKKITVKAE